MRGFLRMALPLRLRRQHEWRFPNAQLLAYFRVPSVATFLARRQLRWLGHLSRLDTSRVPHMMMSARRVATGVGCRGCRGPSLLGVYGQQGTYSALIAQHLTSAARREFFDGSRAPWDSLANARSQWRDFIASVIV